MGIRALAERRPLSTTERAVTEALLLRPFPGRDELLRQLSFASVWGECECGCPTIDVSIPAEAGLPAPLADGIVAEDGGETDQGDRFDLLLWVRAGYLSTLEVVVYGVNTPNTLSPDALERFTGMT